MTSPTQGSRGAGPPDDPTDPDDFLFQLYRGSALLLEDRVVEARDALERALALRPRDARGQDLLAGVYFRLGVYPRAIELWRSLVGAYPNEVSLRINLALALLKTGQPDEACEHLLAAVALAPAHERAWSYLGLAHWRRGRLEEAREAFLRGGQFAMARRMEELLAGPDSGAAAPAAEQEDEAAMREAARQALERVEHAALALEVEVPAQQTAAGAWSPVELGREPVGRMTPRRSVPPAGSVPSLESWLERAHVARPADGDLIVDADGRLVLHAAHEVCARLEGLRAVHGVMRVRPVLRRQRGVDSDEPLGGALPVYRWKGPVTAVLAPAPARRFVAVRLAEELLFLREELLFAFEARLRHESARLIVGGETLEVVQLQGPGIVVVRLEQTPVTIALDEGEETHVHPNALVGWTGRLVPVGHDRGSTQPYAVHAPPVALRGRGTVIVQ
ncbi:MAG: tetratricopeptide repeat protein [Myxococcota bacterium]|nr:tetratricopeptide repeat protein [Myxococcota bacterium]MDW8363532.1 tetratricopeptide repeat protein [Myxococcales bacterium]